MEVAVRGETAEITLGPVLFNWQPERWRDFYFGIADEGAISAVYLGEVVCSKRSPLFLPHFEEVSERLAAAGKTVIFSTLSEVMLNLDRQAVKSVCASPDALVEANDAAAVFHLQGRPHHVGPFMNVYNAETAAVLARRGARNFCLPAELPAGAIRALCAGTQALGVTVEIQVFGRVSLALSARCYHARAHGRTRDSCLFVCENDPDGLELRTLDGRPFLAVNGIQTLSLECLNLIHELPELRAMGVSRFRLSPHTCDMAAVAAVVRGVLDQRMTAEEGAARIEAMKLPFPFSNGFYHGKPGNRWTDAAPH